MLSIAIGGTAPDTPENQMALHDWSHAASLPGNDIRLDVISQCLASQVGATTPDASENQMSLHDCSHAASLPGNDVLLEVI